VTLTPERLAAYGADVEALVRVARHAVTVLRSSLPLPPAVRSELADPLDRALVPFNAQGDDK
jgi:hypothetical protein